jgi:hypothetical protein
MNSAISIGSRTRLRSFSMDDNVKKELDKIKKNVNCLKAFKCLQGDLKYICKAEDVGLEAHLKCLESNSSCPFAVQVAEEFYCTCPIRIYISKKLKK